MQRLSVKVIITAAVILLSAAAGFYAGAIKNHDPGLSNLLPENAADTQKEAPTGKFNVLLLGTDGSNTRTDTIILVCFDKDEKKISMLSVPRDTRIKTSTGFHKINSVMPVKGIDGIVDAVQKVTQTKINYYAQVNFKGFREIVDTLGGVQFNVPQKMKYSDPVQDLYINLKPGEQLLNGDKAEQLCRFRSYAEGDLKRTDVQKAFLSALIEQKLTAANIIKAPEVFLLLSKNTKTNFTLTDLLGNIEALKMLKAGNVQSYDMPGTPQNIGGASYFIIDAKKARTLCAEHFNGDYELTQ